MTAQNNEIGKININSDGSINAVRYKNSEKSTPLFTIKSKNRSAWLSQIIKVSDKQITIVDQAIEVNIYFL